MLSNLASSINIKYDYPLAPLTSWKVGGACRVYVAPNSIEEIIDVIKQCQREDLPYLVLGNGSNVLVADEGYDGVVIHLVKSFNKIEIRDQFVHAECGVSLPKLSFSLAKQGIGGFEFYAGIPGTVGGAIVMNAGASGVDTKGILHSVTYIDSKGQLVTDSVDDLEMGFRYSKFLGSKSIILKAVYKGRFSEHKEAVLQLTRKIASRRREKFPLNVPTAGSTFKSPIKGPYPGRLIEDVGLKGYVFGGAQISPQHGNWIININQASSNDIKELIKKMEVIVKENTGIELEREVIYIPEDL